MADDPKVSIIIPMYNAATYVEKVVSRMLEQSYKNIEILLIDDGSEDATFFLCEKYKKKDQRIVTFYQKNEGVSVARNKGLELATGKYVVFVDVDDLPHKHYVEYLLEAILDNSVQLVCCSYNMMKTRNRELPVVYKTHKYIEKEFCSFLPEIMKMYHNAPWGKIFDMDIIRNNCLRFPEGIPYAEDSIFLYEYYSYIDSMIVVSEILYDYNYTNVTSLGRKFYSDFYQYLYRRLDSKIKCLKRKKILDSKNFFIEQERMDCFELCLKHYILSEKNLKRRNQYIQKSAEVFQMYEINGIYSDEIKNQKWNKISLKWVINHKKEYLISLMRHIFK